MAQRDLTSFALIWRALSASCTLPLPARWPAPTARKTVPGFSSRALIQSAQRWLRVEEQALLQLLVVFHRLVERLGQRHRVAGAPGVDHPGQRLFHVALFVDRLDQQRDLHRLGQALEEAELLLGGLEAGDRLADRVGMAAQLRLDAVGGVIAQMLERRAGQRHCREPGLHMVDDGNGQLVLREQRLEFRAHRLGQLAGERRAGRVQRLLDDARLCRGIGLVGDLQHQLLRALEGGLDRSLVPADARAQQVDGAEQVDGRVGIAHHPERRLGVDGRRGGLGRLRLRLGSERRGDERQECGKSREEPVALDRQDGSLLACARLFAALRRKRKRRCLTASTPCAKARGFEEPMEQA